jgi:hypothetical protein
MFTIKSTKIHSYRNFSEVFRAYAFAIPKKKKPGITNTWRKLMPKKKSHWAWFDKICSQFPIQASNSATT